MAKQAFPVTPAIRQLRDKKIDYIPHLYEYEENGGTRQTSLELNVEEHCIIKTLVMENDSGEIFLVLMHGDCEVSLKELARLIGAKSVQPASAKLAENKTGYKFGGTSPFGTLRSLIVYAEASIFELEKIYINGGKRGFILEILSGDLKIALNIIEINAAIHK